ncbi:hypothetical protein CFELI_13400 [Corynebacterium felinum]|uniref:PPE family protein n=2 Tax=Corynebacterium felinum TaxID=131318 RepID=A0ABU2B639_9CORY|nr:hypothetical protein [Corynebacterium felinum]MDR7354087.1 hypothetical protein [Corynebacterium felinum]WJY96259.1 hypothetical protein CFELI_13400 [Corynebacterium felinum]
MTSLHIDVQQLVESIDALGSIHDFAAMTSAFKDVGLLDGFSSVSGLDQMGRYHGQVLEGSVGSAKEMMAALKRQVQWLGRNLHANLDALSGMDRFFAEAIDAIENGGTPSTSGVRYPVRPALGFEAFDFPTPVTSRASSLQELLSGLMSTNNAGALDAAATWANLSSRTLDMSTKLRQVATDMTASNRGEVFDAAAPRIIEMANASANFAHNAGLMSQSVAQLAMIAPSFTSAVGAAIASLEAMQTTQVGALIKKQAEEMYLIGFKEALSTSITAAMPVIRNLMEPASAGAGGGQSPAAISQGHAGGGITRTSQTATGMGIEPQVLAEQVLDTVASQQATLGFDPNVVNPLNMHQYPGGANSLGASTTSWGPNTGGPGGMNPIAGAGGLGGVNTAGSQSGAFNQHGTGGRGTSAGVGSGTGYGVGGAPVAGGHGSSGGVGAGGSNSGGGSRSGAGGAYSTGGLRGNGTGSGSGSGSGSGRGGHVGGGGTGSGTGSNAGQGSSGAGAAGSSGRGSTMMGGAPMGGTGTGGAGGAGGRENRRRTTPRTRRGGVKGILQQAEREGNLRDLLGDAPKVVPRVIGADVFKPRDQR